MSFEEHSVKEQNQFPEGTTHVRFMNETDQNDVLTLGAAVPGKHYFFSQANHV